jgi:hypothetical protein
MELRASENQVYVNEDGGSKGERGRETHGDRKTRRESRRGSTSERVTMRERVSEGRRDRLRGWEGER